MNTVSIIHNSMRAKSVFVNLLLDTAAAPHFVPHSTKIDGMASPDTLRNHM